MMNAPSWPSAPHTAHTSSSLPTSPEPLDLPSTMTGMAGPSTGSEWLPTPAPHVHAAGALGSSEAVTRSVHGGRGTPPSTHGRGRGGRGCSSTFQQTPRADAPTPRPRR
eukprot:1127146-Pleurochrysis_carterae.AAC.1